MKFTLVAEHQPPLITAIVARRQTTHVTAYHRSSLAISCHSWAVVSPLTSADTTTVRPKKAKMYSGRAGRPIMRVMLGKSSTVMSMHSNKFRPHTIKVIKIAVVSLALVRFIDTKIQVTCSRKRKSEYHLVSTSGMVKLARNFLNFSLMNAPIAPHQAPLQQEALLTLDHACFITASETRNELHMVRSLSRNLALKALPVPVMMERRE
mmetsp:Transcript_9039/g.15283  ORF Transcript_9039/g.15283 Transcript_9039/m.15283 type:complete len:208 (-) Transcript_9039:3497-4120(-)